MTLTTLTMERAHDAAMAGDATLPERPLRRTFSAEYKRRVLAEYEAAIEDGSRGAILRREGLYSSHIVDWRRARDAGALAGLAPKPRPRVTPPEGLELARLRRRAERAEADLARAWCAFGSSLKAVASTKPDRRYIAIASQRTSRTSSALDHRAGVDRAEVTAHGPRSPSATRGSSPAGTSPAYPAGVRSTSE
jgi:transposase